MRGGISHSVQPKSADEDILSLRQARSRSQRSTPLFNPLWDKVDKYIPAVDSEGDPGHLGRAHWLRLRRAHGARAHRCQPAESEVLKIKGFDIVHTGCTEVQAARLVEGSTEDVESTR